MNSNLQRLGDTLSGRMTKTAGAAVPATTELGTINSNLSLSADSLGTPIPKGAYMVDIRLSCSTYNTSSTTHSHSGGTHSGHQLGDGSHNHTGGEHKHRIPEEFRALQPGDRVLINWCGYEPVVVAIVVSS